MTICLAPQILQSRPDWAGWEEQIICLVSHVCSERLRRACHMTAQKRMVTTVQTLDPRTKDARKNAIDLTLERDLHFKQNRILCFSLLL